MRHNLRYCLLMLFVFVTSLHGYAQTTNIVLPKAFYKKLKGTIGKSNVTMDINKKDSVLTGSYYYNSIGTSLSLKGKIDRKGNFLLSETNENGKQTGIFKGSFTDTCTISGTWAAGDDKTKNNKSFTFNLKQVTEGFANIIEKNGSEQFCISEKLKDTIAPYSSDTCSNTSVSAFQVVIPDKSIQKSINNFIKDVLISNQGDDSPHLSDTVSFDNCINSILTSLDDTASIGSSLNVGYGITTNDNYILGFYISQWSYGAGAAHGAGMSNYYNIDLKTGEQIKLDELLLPGYVDTLNKIAEKLFVAQNGNAGWNFDSGSFKLNDNFVITTAGLLYQYNVYEIGSYAAGAPEVLIPYRSIDALINPDGLLSVFWKKRK
jgi:hypothetical protein